VSGDEGADERAEGRDAAEPPDDASGAVEIAQLELDDHRSDRTQGDRGEEEPGEGEEQARAATALRRLIAERSHDRDREQREDATECHGCAEQAPGVDAVRDLPASPRAECDSRE